MEIAEICNKCSCGAISDMVCDGCGKAVCSACFTRQICSFEADNIVVKHYCPKCARDIRKDVWGALYWKELVSLYV